MAWDNLSDVVFAHAARDPAAPALIDNGSALSYADLAAFTARASVYLRDLGIVQGVRIGIALGNSIDHIVLVLAALRVGAVLVELSADDSGDALVATAHRYGLRAIFTEAHVTLPLGIVQHRMTLSWRNELLRKQGDCRAVADADELEILSLTTGSTGVPSGIISTQRQFMRRIELRLAVYYPKGIPDGTRPNDLLLTAPMRYGWFFTCALLPLVAGGRLVILPRFDQASDLVRAIATWKGAICCVTANMCRFFLASAPAEGRLFPHLAVLEASGLPLFPWEKRDVTARVAANFIESYGTAAVGAISYMGPADMARRPESVGRPLPRLQLQIVDDDGTALLVGAYGKIRCRDPLMPRPCAENIDQPRAEYVRDGWYYPGDIGMVDTDGYLHLRGRAAEIIRRGANEVFAPEIEAAIAQHPAIAEVAVVGAMSPTRGEEVIAFVIKAAELSHDEVERHCRAALVVEQRPDRIYYLNDLPRIAGGKIDRARLQSLALGEAVRQSGVA